MRAWESFVAEGEDEARPDPHVRPLIQQSWHRCALSSIDATRGAAPLAQERGGARPAALRQPRAARRRPRLVRPCRPAARGRAGHADPDRPRRRDRRDHRRSADARGRAADPPRGGRRLERARGRHQRHRHGTVDRRAGVRACGRAFLCRDQALELCRRPGPRPLRQSGRGRRGPVRADRHLPPPQHGPRRAGRPGDRGGHGAAAERRARPAARDLPGLAPQHRARGRRDPARSAWPRHLYAEGARSGADRLASSATSSWACGCSTSPSA